MYNGLSTGIRICQQNHDPNFMIFYKIDICAWEREAICPLFRIVALFNARGNIEEYTNRTILWALLNCIFSGNLDKPVPKNLSRVVFVSLLIASYQRLFLNENSAEDVIRTT